MMRMLDSILQKLSQIAANKNMAIPLLMFLSCELLTNEWFKYFNGEVVACSAAHSALDQVMPARFKV